MADTVVKYRIPLETVDGVDKPVYKVNVNGQLYMYHYGTDTLTVIQEKGSGHLHKDGVNVGIEELPKDEVENTEDLVEVYA